MKQKSNLNVINSIDLTPAQVLRGYEEASEASEKLKSYGVRLPKGDLDHYPDKEGVEHWTLGAIWLGILTCYVGRYVKKDAISAWEARQYGPLKFGRDAQCRHLWELGWNIGVRGSRHPATGDKMPKGCYCLYSLEEASPKFVARKRAARGIGAGKVVAGSDHCFTCLAKKGESHPLYYDIVELRKAHKDPGKDLTADNTVPQCQFCNDPSKDDFVLNDRGLATAVASIGPVLRANERVRRMVFKELRHQFENTVNQQAVSACPPTP